MPCRWLMRIAATTAIVWLVLGVRHAAAQAARQAADPIPFVEDARRYAIESIQPRVQLRLHEKSLLNWTNPTRQQERGTIFTWLHEGRPLAIGSIFTYEFDGKVYTKHEFHSLASGGLSAKLDGTLAWAPQSAGIVWQRFPSSPQPVTTRTGRLLQMRQLARNFRAELIDPKNQRTELRLAPRPLWEYSAISAGVVDGAILSFVVATDPELLLLIEAFEEVQNGAKSMGYRYAFARFHYWQLVAYDGDRKIWEAPLDTSHELNYLGNSENRGKAYNSFHPNSRADARQ